MFLWQVSCKGCRDYWRKRAVTLGQDGWGRLGQDGWGRLGTNRARVGARGQRQPGPSPAPSTNKRRYEVFVVPVPTSSTMTPMGET